MKITTITLARGGTINTGNFNNSRLEVSATIELETSESPEAAYEKLHAWVHEKAKKEAKI